MQATTFSVADLAGKFGVRGGGFLYTAKENLHLGAVVRITDALVDGGVLRDGGRVGDAGLDLPQGDLVADVDGGIRAEPLVLRYYETPHHDTVTCHFDDRHVQITFMNSMAQMSPTPKDKRPLLRGTML